MNLNEQIAYDLDIISRTEIAIADFNDRRTTPEAVSRLIAALENINRRYEAAMFEKKCREADSALGI